MALETIVFQQDPFTSTYGCKDIYAMDDSEVAQSHVREYCSPENEVSTDAFFTETYPPPATASRRKRRRIKASKNKEEVENQRMTHIAVERNRRKQMNDYLALLRSLMPPSYAQRGDQASIVGGAINYVKELEQHLQYLESQKQKMKHREQSKPNNVHESDPLVTKFFTFPQYSTSPATNRNNSQSSAEADIEVTMVESHANIKVLSKRQPKQLFKMVSGFQSIGLTVLHLNITTIDHRVLYSFNLKVENDCQVTTVNDIATAVREMVVMIKEEAIFC
ncbi:Transcription factor bHLH96 [Heracleum sosnowskyi]|uniref:Transcription factor bHLH96 n=1 Tax=Heracleum sosnowskyi TaxID=360622 RepID=A0AAD8MW81_9APIA|nr:Transcription factor bHLH96 [Heracleum sosnowskyi]